VIFGTSIKEDMKDEIVITVIATGFEDRPASDALTETQRRGRGNTGQGADGGEQDSENDESQQDSESDDENAGDFRIPTFLQK
jgi:cell division protein FtsZ